MKYQIGELYIVNNSYLGPLYIVIITNHGDGKVIKKLNEHAAHSIGALISLSYYSSYVPLQLITPMDKIKYL